MHIMRDDTEKKRPPRTVDADTARSRQQLIGRKLRDLYDSVLDEGVPEDFERLLGELDKVATDKVTAGAEAETEGAGRPGEGVSDG